MTTTKSPIQILRDALTDICDPIAAMQRDLPEGYSLNGAMAVAMCDKPQHYKDIAAKALRLTEGVQDAPGEAVYQWRNRVTSTWHDTTKEEAYSRVDERYEARTLYTHPTPTPTAEVMGGSGDILTASQMRAIAKAIARRVAQNTGKAPELCFAPALFGLQEYFGAPKAAAEVLAANEEAAAGAVPEGWKLVPIEPTDAMREACPCHEYYADIDADWHAMLDASPTAPSQGLPAAAPDCTRSHPREAMDAACEHKAVRERAGFKRAGTEPAPDGALISEGTIAANPRPSNSLERQNPQNVDGKAEHAKRAEGGGDVKAAWLTWALESDAPINPVSAFYGGWQARGHQQAGVPDGWQPTATAPMCERKTNDIMRREGYQKTGYVLMKGDPAARVCVSDGGAVSWFTLDQWNWLMHNRDHVEFQWPKPIGAAPTPTPTPGGAKS